MRNSVLGKLLAFLAFIVAAFGPLVWAVEQKCVDCVNYSCEWKVGYPHQVCTEFAGGNGCVAGGGACELQ